jgi:hypothetical protein
MTPSTTNRTSTIDAALAARVASLHKEHTDLLYHHRELVARGIGSQTGELHERLAEITAEIHAITRHLHATADAHHDPEGQDNP